MRHVFWLSSVAIMTLMFSTAIGQDAEDRDSWVGGTGDWNVDDNWVDNGSAPSIVPTFDDDRWALVAGGTAQVGGSFDVGGLEIGGSGTVEIAAGASLEVKNDPSFFTVGQSTLNGRLRLLGDGSYKGLDGTVGGTIEISPAGSFELSGDATLRGTYALSITGDGTPTLKVGKAAKLSGTVAPTFDGVSPAFGDSFKFVEAGSVELGKTSVELPAGVSLGRGLDARVEADANSASLVFGNLPILEVHRATGAARILNVVGGPVTMTGYSLRSPGGKLNPDGFSGLGGDAFVRPNPLATELSEISLESQAEVPVDTENGIGIGNAYNGGATHPLDEDVSFQFVTLEGAVLNGLVEYAGPANDLVLNLHPETGEATLRHESSFIDPIEVTGYSIISVSESLKAADFNSLASSGAGGDGWAEANPGAGIISELNLSNSTIFDTGTVLSLGPIFDPAATRDLVLEYTTLEGVLKGTVEYRIPDGVTPKPFLEADFNQDGIVNFTDFLVLSTQFNQTVDPPGNPPDINGDGTVNFPDFLVLSTQFNMTSGGAAAVPEPAGLGLFGLGGLLVLMTRCRRKRA